MKIQLTELLTKNMLTASLQVNFYDLHDDKQVIIFDKRHIRFSINKRKSLCWFRSALM